jgi:hypothetical protein
MNRHRFKFSNSIVRRRSFAISPRVSREFCWNVTSPEYQRAQGIPGARCARSLACRIKKHTSIVTTVTPVHPAFPAQWFTAYSVLSPATGLSCHRRRRENPADLTPASGRQDHTASPSASGTFVRAPSASTASRPALMTLRNAPLWDGMAIDIDLIWVSGEEEYFFGEGWTRHNRKSNLICPSGKSTESNPDKHERNSTFLVPGRTNAMQLSPEHNGF